MHVLLSNLVKEGAFNRTSLSVETILLASSRISNNVRSNGLRLVGDGNNAGSVFPRVGSQALLVNKSGETKATEYWLDWLDEKNTELKLGG